MRRLALALVVAASGCIIETFPLPEATDNEPTTRGDSVHTSAIYYTENPAILVGAEAAVTALSRVVVTNPSRQDWQGETDSAFDGSFNMPMSAAAGEILLIQVWQDNTLMAAAELLIQPPSVDARASNAELESLFETDAGSGLVGVTDPDAQGMVQVQGEPGTLPPGIAVVVANVNGGNSQVAYAATDGSFTVRLAAKSGDELWVFAVEPASSNAGVSPVTVFVL